MALSLWAMWRVKSVYKRYSQGVVRSGLTGGQVAAQILRRTGISDVEITAGVRCCNTFYPAQPSSAC
jgi:Zn-dependent membrane protease YugP